MALFAGAGFQCATHAVGDLAVRCALDAYEAAGAGATGVHHRIEHIELLQDGPAALRRIGRGRLHAAAAHGRVRAGRQDEWGRGSGPSGLRRRSAAQILRASGAILALGSDWMVAPFDPRIGMAWARLRRTPGLPGVAPPRREQALTALRDAGGVHDGGGAAGLRGASLRPDQAGYRADLTGFAADPVDTDADELPDLPVLMTIVDGRIVHEAREA